MWEEGVENDVRKNGIVNWRQVAQDRDGWRRATGEVLILIGKWSHRRRRRVRIVASYQRFGTSCRSNIKGQAHQEILLGLLDP